MTDWEKTYEEFWKEICEKDGVPDMDAIKKELGDFYKLMENATLVYMHVTGGRISKMNTKASAVIAESDDYYTRLLEREIEELKKSISA